MSDAGYSMLGAGACGWPREMLWGGRWEGGSCLGTHVRIKDFKIKKIKNKKEIFRCEAVHISSDQKCSVAKHNKWIHTLMHYRKSEITPGVKVCQKHTQVIHYTFFIHIIICILIFHT